MAVVYQGYNRDFSSIADRRRLVHWAKLRKIELKPLSQSVELANDDIVIITSSGDFAQASRLKKTLPKIRLIFDVVDGIHGDSSKIRDLARGLVYCTSRQVSSYPASLKSLLRKYLKNFDHLICSSQEQEVLWKNFFSGSISTILDFHSEIPRGNWANNDESHLSFLWEGLPYTLHHLQDLDDLLSHFGNSKLHILTSLQRKRYFNRYVDFDVNKTIIKSLPAHINSIQVTPWTIENLTEASQKSSFGVLPISLGKSYDSLKAENRLLIMWRLGIPTLTGPLPSYKRLEKAIGIKFVCHNKVDWINLVTSFRNNPQLTSEYLTRVNQYLEASHNEQLLLKKWDDALFG